MSVFQVLNETSVSEKFCVYAEGAKLNITWSYFEMICGDWKESWSHNHDYSENQRCPRTKHKVEDLCQFSEDIKHKVLITSAKRSKKYCKKHSKVYDD